VHVVWPGHWAGMSLVSEARGGVRCKVDSSTRAQPAHVDVLLERPGQHGCVAAVGAPSGGHTLCPDGWDLIVLPK
jgi:hypothetical protein